MPTTWSGADLSALNYFMKDYPSGKIRPTEVIWHNLYDALKGNIHDEQAVGDSYEVLLQTVIAHNARPFGENISIPYPAKPQFVRVKIPTAEVIANAGVTKQALDKATGGVASWERVVVRAIDDCRQRNWPNLMDIAAMGSGNGFLAEANGTATYAAGPPKLLKVQCDNTYGAAGGTPWDDVAMIVPGMYVEAYKADGTTRISDTDGTTTYYEWRVNKVYPGLRTASGNYAAPTPSATNACVWLEVYSDINALFDNGAKIYVAGTKSSGITLNNAAGTGLYDTGTCLPVGLFGLVQDAVHWANTDFTTFQGVTRADYPVLLSSVRDATNFAGGALGTPDTWDLSDITDSMNAAFEASGKWASHLICNSKVAMAIHRLNRAEGSINVSVGTTPQQQQIAMGSMMAKRFMRPDGVEIPIIVAKRMSPHILYGICADDLFWLLRGNFDWLGPRLGSGVWNKSYNDRYANFEAPFGGYANIAAEACNSHFAMLDLRHDL